MRVGFEGAQDYDLALRVTERTSDRAHSQNTLSLESLARVYRIQWCGETSQS